MDSPEVQDRSARRKAFAVHVLTASGAITGLLALQSVIDGNIRAALLWLIACQILDGIDGPIARKDRKSTRLNSSHEWISRMPSSA